MNNNPLLPSADNEKLEKELKKEGAEMLYQLALQHEVDHRREASIAYFQQAADGGHVKAQNRLGLYCELDGKKFEAVKYYQKAANQGDPVAQHKLGVFYEHGYGVEQNFETALKYFQQAAGGGHVEAQFRLGCYYELKNAERATEYFQLAADGGHVKAQFRLGLVYAGSEGVSKNLEMAFECYKKAAIQGNAEAQYAVGVCYERGQGVQQDVEEAAHWYFTCYYRVEEEEQEEIEEFLKQHSPYLLSELNKSGNPIQFIKDCINDPDKELLSRAYECMGLLKDKRISDKISDEISKNEEVADLLGAIFYDAAEELHSSETVSEDDQHAMMSFFLAIPKTSIFSPFALDFLAGIKMAMYGDNWQLAWEKGGVREIRQQIREFTSRYCYYASQPDAHGKAVLKFFVSTKTALSEQRQHLLSKRKLNLQDLHDHNLAVMRSTLAKLPKPPSSRSMEEDDAERPTKKPKTEEGQESSRTDSQFEM